MYQALRSLDTKSSFVTQYIDVWSIGCVLAVAAVWMTGGRDAIHKFQHARIEASKKLPGPVSDVFHDGKTVAGVVLQTLEGIADDQSQPYDRFTPKIASLVIKTLSATEKKPTMKELSLALRKILILPGTDSSPVLEPSTMKLPTHKRRQLSFDLEDSQTSKYYQRLQQFNNNSEAKVVEFPVDLTVHDRRIIHAIAEHLNLLHDSQGSGEQRRIRVRKLSARSEDLLSVWGQESPSMIVRQSDTRAAEGNTMEIGSASIDTTFQKGSPQLVDRRRSIFRYRYQPVIPPEDVGASAKRRKVAPFTSSTPDLPSIRSTTGLRTRSFTDENRLQDQASPMTHMAGTHLRSYTDNSVSRDQKPLMKQMTFPTYSLSSESLLNILSSEFPELEEKSFQCRVRYHLSQFVHAVVTNKNLCNNRFITIVTSSKFLLVHHR